MKNTFNMKDAKVKILCVKADGIASIQKSINQWMTTGLLIKYEIIPNGDEYLFNILLRK